MKKFFEEFKKFITRGNVIDLAVGVIIGSAFTAIVTALSNNILKPVINKLMALVLGKGSLSEVYTFLGEPTYLEDGTIDLANSFYIDWGAFINAIINFFIVAIVLFVIIKVMNRIKDGNIKIKEKIEKETPTKEERREMKALGIKLSNKDAVKEFIAKKREEARLIEEEAKKAEEEKAAAERAANPTTEDLLKEILVEMKKEK